MKVLYNKKLRGVTQALKSLTDLADIPAMPTNLAEAKIFLDTAATPEIRQARKILLHGTMYGAGPQLMLKALSKQ